MVAAYQAVAGYGTGVIDRGGVLQIDPVMSTKQGIADLGRQYVTTNATPGTPLLYPLTTAFSATTPSLYLFNGNALGAGVVYIDYVKLLVTQVPASTTVVNFAIIVDTAARAINTNNTVALSPVCTLTPSVNAPSIAGLTVNAQNSATASVLAAATAPKLIGRGSLGGLPILGDELVIDFGVGDISPFSGAALAGRKVSSASAFSLQPQTSVTIHLWFTGNAATALTYELEIGHWER
jgi:hypothetical protein